MNIPPLPEHHLAGWFYGEILYFPDIMAFEVITDKLVDECGIYKEPIEFKASEFLEREIDIDELIETMLKSDLGFDKIKADYLKRYGLP